MLTDDKTCTDVRILKTMETLHSAFTELMIRDGYDRITVETLCCQASICRVTFYNHFDDKQSYLRRYMETAVDGLISMVMKAPPGRGPNDHIRNISNLIFRYLKTNDDLVRLLNESERSDEVAMMLYNMLKKKIAVSMKLKCRNMTQRDAVASFFASGIICLMHVWSCESFKLSEKEFYGIVKRVMNTRFADVIIENTESNDEDEGDNE